MGVCVNLEQGKLSLGEELARRAEKLLEQSIPAQLKDFEQRLVNVKEKHEGIKARYAEQVKVLNEDVAAKNGVGALCVLCEFALELGVRGGMRLDARKVAERRVALPYRCT